MFGNNDDPFGGFTTPKPQSIPQSSTPVGATGGGNTFQTGNSTPAQAENKYQILNMFWMINPKAYNNGAFLDGEVHFTSISYNVNFGNLRVELANMTQESIVGQMICLNKVNRLVSATLYPTASFQIVSGIPEVFCMEQIITYTGADWQKNLKPAKITQSEAGIVLSIDSHCYEFSGWQKDAFLYSCKFALNQGLVLSGEGLRNR